MKKGMKIKFGWRKQKLSEFLYADSAARWRQLGESWGEIVDGLHFLDALFHLIPPTYKSKFAESSNIIA